MPSGVDCPLKAVCGTASVSINTLQAAKPSMTRVYRLPLLRRLHGETIHHQAWRGVLADDRKTVSEAVAAVSDAGDQSLSRKIMGG